MEKGDGRQREEEERNQSMTNPVEKETNGKSEFRQASIPTLPCSHYEINVIDWGEFGTDSSTRRGVG